MQAFKNFNIISRYCAYLVLLNTSIHKSDTLTNDVFSNWLSSTMSASILQYKLKKSYSWFKFYLCFFINFRFALYVYLYNEIIQELHSGGWNIGDHSDIHRQHKVHTFLVSIMNRNFSLAISYTFLNGYTKKGLAAAYFLIDTIQVTNRLISTDRKYHQIVLEVSIDKRISRWKLKL